MFAIKVNSYFVESPFFLDLIGKTIEAIEPGHADFIIHLTDGTKIKIGDAVHKKEFVKLTIDGYLDGVIGSKIVRLDDCIYNGIHTFDIVTDTTYVAFETNIVCDDPCSDFCFDVLAYRPNIFDSEGNPMVFHQTFYISSQRQDKISSDDGLFSTKLM